MSETNFKLVTPSLAVSDWVNVNEMHSLQHRLCAPAHVQHRAYEGKAFPCYSAVHAQAIQRRLRTACRFSSDHFDMVLVSLDKREHFKRGQATTTLAIEQNKRMRNTRTSTPGTRTM